MLQVYSSTDKDLSQTHQHVNMSNDLSCLTLDVVGVQLH